MQPKGCQSFDQSVASLRTKYKFSLVRYLGFCWKLLIDTCQNKSKVKDLSVKDLEESSDSKIDFESVNESSSDDKDSSGSDSDDEDERGKRAITHLH